MAISQWLLTTLVLAGGLPPQPEEARLLVSRALDYRAAVLTRFEGYFGSAAWAWPNGRGPAEPSGREGVRGGTDEESRQVTSEYLRVTDSGFHHEAAWADAWPTKDPGVVYEWTVDDGVRRRSVTVGQVADLPMGADEPSHPVGAYQGLLEALGLTFLTRPLAQLVSPEWHPVPAAELPPWAVAIGNKQTTLYLAPELGYAPVRLEYQAGNNITIRQWLGYREAPPGIWVPSYFLTVGGLRGVAADGQPSWFTVTARLVRLHDLTVGEESGPKSLWELRLPVGATAFVNGQPQAIGEDLARLRRLVMRAEVPWGFTQADLTDPMPLPTGLPVLETSRE